MSVALVSSLPVSPSLEEAQELARDYNVIPLRHTFIDDTETPVSAFLKLRGRGPAFLLESAEQGQRFGRYSFLGFRPRAQIRYQDGRLEVIEESGRRPLDGPDPYRAVASYLSGYSVAPVDGLPPFAGGAVGLFGYDLSRTVERLPEPNPDDIGTPDMALMVSDALVVFDHLSHQVTIMVNAFVDGPDEVESHYERGVGLIERARELLAAPTPRARPHEHPAEDPVAAFASNMERAGYERSRRAGQGIHLRRGHLPGRSIAPLERPVPGPSVLPLPRPAHRQPLAVHVLPGVRRLLDRGRLAGAAAEGDRPPRGDPADRGHPSAGRDPRARTSRSRRSCSRTRRSAPST